LWLLDAHHFSSPKAFFSIPSSIAAVTFPVLTGRHSRQMSKRENGDADPSRMSIEQ
jgi:hypothetical protein